MIAPDDRELLEFEEAHAGISSAAKYSDARRDFNLSASAYVRRMHRLLDTPEVEAAYPMLVHRARRIREHYVAARRTSRIP